MFGGGRRMKKLALLIGSIGLFMICFGLGWILGEKAVNDYICNKTTDIKYFTKNCVEDKYE